MPDVFRLHEESLVTPATNASTVTPDDNTDLENTSRALFVGTGGNVAVRMKGGADVTFFNVSDGSILSIRVDRVNSTGTTASNMVALW